MKNTAQFSLAWKSPSNIAFVKYWGKREGQLPANASLSMSLAEAYTKTQLIAFDAEEESPSLSLNGTTDHPFLSKIRILLEKMQIDFPILRSFDLALGTTNSFPHSTGIASSASGMSAFALCLLDLANQAKGIIPDEEAFFRQASYYARLGSGSACRSIYGGFTVWGKYPGLPFSDNEFAIPINEKVHPDFLKLQDAILIVSSKPKVMSSSEGHTRMNKHSFAYAREVQAEKNMENILLALSQGDFDSLASLSELEALTLHSLIMTSEGRDILLEPGSLHIIHVVRNARKQGLPVFFTIDAGPNIHLIYPESHSTEVKSMIENELLPYCEDQKVIYDRCGNGPIRIPVLPGFIF